MLTNKNEEIDSEIERKISDIEGKISQGILPAYEVKIFKILAATGRIYLKKKKQIKEMKK